MSYSIELLPSARREWKKLDRDIKQQAVRKLERLLRETRELLQKASEKKK